MYYYLLQDSHTHSPGIQRILKEQGKASPKQLTVQGASFAWGTSTTPVWYRAAPC